jgi:hypothetical protein
MSSIGNLANSIFVNEFDSTGVTVDSISGWLENNVGELNNLLYSSFSGTNGNISGLNLEEQNIYQEMFLHHHYKKQARNTLRGITDNTNNITSVRDGEQTISFVNRNEVSKVYKGLANDAYKRLQYLVYSYNSYQASPRQVGGIESLQQPTGIIDPR